MSVLSFLLHLTFVAGCPSLVPEVSGLAQALSKGIRISFEPGLMAAILSSPPSQARTFLNTPI